MRQLKKPLMLMSVAFMLLSLSACGIQPWVKPYHRANLANEVMQYDRDPISDGYMHHVRQARESARGAEGAGGGGCGCN